jgi:hypothetical protein
LSVLKKELGKKHVEVYLFLFIPTKFYFPRGIIAHMVVHKEKSNLFLEFSGEI